MTQSDTTGFDVRSFTLRRLSARSSRAYAEIVARIEAAATFLNPNEEAPEPLGAEDELTRRLEELAQPNGFILLGRVDHGLLNRLGREGASIQYAIGNPLVAARILARVPAGALYAPFRLAVYEDLEKGDVVIEFDDPADLMGSLGDAEVTEIGNRLSDKIRSFVASVR